VPHCGRGSPHARPDHRRREDRHRRRPPRRPPGRHPGLGRADRRPPRRQAPGPGARHPGPRARPRGDRRPRPGRSPGPGLGAGGRPGHVANFGGRALKFGPSVEARRAILFVSIIDRDFHSRRHGKQSVAPAFQRCAKRTASTRHRRAALQFRFSSEKVAKAFGLRQVDPSIGERTASELARLGHTTSWHGNEGGQYGIDRGPAAVTMKFDQILPGGGRRTGERED